MKLSIVVPCYNEEENIVLFTQRVREVFSGKTEYELIFVDDGSTDRTKEKLNELLLQKKEKIKIVSFSRNFGKEPAMYAGLSRADGEYTALIDADLQQDPLYLLEMTEILDCRDNIDCVCAYQKQRKENKAVASLKDGFYSLADKLSDVNFRKDASDFRVFRRCVLEAVLSLTEYKRFSKGIFSFVGFSTEYIPYEVGERAYGKSKWSVRSLFLYAADGIFSFSTKPPKLATVLSVISMLTTFALLIAFAVTGFSLQKIIILLLFAISGGLYLCIGILGKYVTGIFMQGKNRPVYIVREEKEN